MTIVTIHAAKLNLARLIARAGAGEEIILAHGKEPVARLVPICSPAGERRFGALKGEITVGREFFGPLPEEELKVWE